MKNPNQFIFECICTEWHYTASLHNIATPPEEDRATATGDLHTKFREDLSSGPRDNVRGRTDTETDTQTVAHTDRQRGLLQYSATPRRRVISFFQYAKN